MVKTNRRAIECGEVRVHFIARKDMEGTAVVERKTPRGLLRVASPEATALGLVGYADQSGGLDNVASVLAELVEAIDPERLVSECGRSPIAWVQRLGYLLDLTEHRDLADKVAAKHARAATVEETPDPLHPGDDNATVTATPVDRVFEFGFDPLEGGFRAQSIEGNEFEIIDQWIEVVPTDQVAAVAVKYDPVTGRQIPPA